MRLPRFSLRDHFVPHTGNRYLPALLRRGALLGMLFLVVLSFAASNLYALLWQSSQWLVSAVLPAVVITDTNEERDAVDLPPLVRNPVLDAAAKLKAEDMATRGYFAHYSPSGVSPWHWFAEAGYSFVHAGENLAVHFTDSDAVVEAWMNSPTHRANIVNGNYREIGVGTAKGRFEGFETVFVVQLFGAPAVPRSSTTVVTTASVGATPELATIVPLREQVAGIEGVATLAEDLTPRAVVPEPVLPTPTPEAVVVAKTVVEDEVVSLYTDTVATSTDLTPLPLATTGQSLDAAGPGSPLGVVPMTSPRSLLQYVYLVVGALTALALVLATIIEWRRHHPRQILYGVGLLCMMSFLFWIHTVVTAGVTIL